MSESNGQGKLWSDVALEDQSQDQLGYSDFAENIASTIRNKAPETEFVVGIYGQWGSGKSSILNFIENELKESEDDPVVVKFNPWWFSGQTDLINKFFTQLQSELGTEPQFNEASAQLAKLSRSVAKLPIDQISGMPLSQILSGAAGLVEPGNESINELKDSISEDLKDSDRSIIVLIDDIDRLTNEEILQMFRLIKSVADFPNVIYVLAFDQDIVTEALESSQRGVQNGTEYLEKIVQLPQHVPIPAEDSLHLFFTNRLSAIVGEDEVQFDSSHWQSVYFDGIRPLIQTPRDAIRLTNAVNTSYQSLRREVNYLDLVAIEAIRVHSNHVYDKIRNNKQKFTNKSSLRQLKDPDYSFVWDEFQGTDRKSLEILLSYLFPRYASDTSTEGSGVAEDTSTYRKRRRVCHPEIFPYYFRQTVPEGAVTTDRFEHVMSLVGDPDEFADSLTQLSNEQRQSGRSKANSFLKRFEEHLSEVETPEEVIKALLQVGDELTTVDPPQNPFDRGNRAILVQIILSLLSETDDPVLVLERGASEGNSPFLFSEIVVALLSEHGEYDSQEVHESEKTVEYDDLVQLKSTAVNLFEKCADEDKLRSAPNVNRILNKWDEWSTDNTPAKWAAETTEDIESLIWFVGEFLQERNSSSYGTYEVVSPEWIEPFLDIDEVKDRFQHVEQTDLSDDDIRVIEIFEKGCTYHESGKDPGEFGVWDPNE